MKLFSRPFCGALIFVLLFTATPIAASVTIAVTDAKLLNCIAEYGAKKGWSKPEQYIELQCHGKKIRSLVGLESYHQLEKLSLFNNLITEFSVEQLEKLRYLNLSRNKLSKLDVSGYSKLKDLLVFGNELTTINLTSLAQLDALKASNNKLKRIHYSVLPTLKKVYLFDNQIEDLDIQALPKLTYMDVRQNPMPGKLCEQMDQKKGVTILHDGSAEDW